MTQIQAMRKRKRKIKIHLMMQMSLIVRMLILQMVPMLVEKTRKLLHMLPMSLIMDTD
jgi:hypothetical protein